jgi:uncharacterized protein YabE (DUF348 family)
VRKIIPAVAAGATALALAGGSLAYASFDKDVTLSVDGATTDLSTTSSSVAEVLEQEGITLGEHDVVAPDPATKVTDGTRIAVQYGRQVKVDVDGREQSMWTTATRVDQALAALKVNTSGAAMSTSRSASIGREGLALKVATVKTVTVDAAGTKKQVRTTGQTVADVLRAVKITPDSDDKLSAKPTARVASGTSLAYTKVDVTKTTKKTDIDYETVRKRTSKLDQGETEVDTTGRQGERTLTYEETRHNGKLVSKKKVSSKVTDEPRSKVVLVGTRVEEPAPAKKSSSSSNSSSSSSSSKKSSSDSAPSVASGGVWDRIAQCESGGNWSINTGNGYYGGLQFTPSTWRAFGGSGMPHQASRAEQIAVAKRVQAGQGWGAWPACTSKLGIR